MKIFKKLLPLLVIVTILLSVAIIPASAADYVSGYDYTAEYEGRWYFIDLENFGTQIQLRGEFILPAYNYYGTHFYFDFSSYRSFKQINWNGSVLTGITFDGAVQTLSSDSNVFAYNRFIFVQSLSDEFNEERNYRSLSLFDDFETAAAFNLDGLTIPYITGTDFEEITGFIPNFATLDGYLSFRASNDDNWHRVYGDGAEITSGDMPYEFDNEFTLYPSTEGNILNGFGAITSWITTSLGSLDVIFFANGGLTPLGILCIFGLAIGLAFLLFNVVKNFLEMRS